MCVLEAAVAKLVSVLCFRVFRCAMHTNVVRDNELRRLDDSIHLSDAFTQNNGRVHWQLNIGCVRCDDAL